MAKFLGKHYCICRNSGTYGSPAFIPLIAARDIKVANKPSATFDSTDRAGLIATGTLLTKTEIPTRRMVELSFSAIWNGGAGLTALRDAFVAGTAVQLAALDEMPTEGGAGYFGDWAVTKFPLKFPLTDGQMIDIALQPHGNYTNAVVAYTDATVAAGTAETQATKKLGTNGSVNDSSNNPITAVKDFSFDLEWELNKSDDRASTFDMVVPTALKVSADVEFQWNSGDSQLAAFKTALEANSAITLSLLDGPYATIGSWGLKIDWAVTDFPLEANLTDGQMVKVKLVPHGNYTTAPAFLTIS